MKQSLQETNNLGQVFGWDCNHVIITMDMKYLEEPILLIIPLQITFKKEMEICMTEVRDFGSRIQV